MVELHQECHHFVKFDTILHPWGLCGDEQPDGTRAENQKNVVFQHNSDDSGLFST